jgi:CRP-like cAMP-binding protein/Zn-dependent protease
LGQDALGEATVSLGTVVVVILVVLVMGAFVGNLRASRRRVRRGPSLDRLMKEALGEARAITPPGVWGSLAGRLVRPTPPPVDGGVYGRLAADLDPANFRPRLAPDVEVKEFHLRWGNDYAMLANPRDLLHLRVEIDDVPFIAMMDGTRTVKEIIVERLRGTRELEVADLADLVEQLRRNNFLDRRFVDVDAAVRSALDPSPAATRKAREFARTLSVEWEGADRLVGWCYRHGGAWFFRPPLLALSALTAVGGLIAFFAVEAEGRFELSATSAAAATLVLLGMDYVLTFVHELGHALVVAHHGRHVRSAGFMIYFGSPAFFVDVSDSLMMERRQRIAQSFAGPFAELIVAGLASAYILAFPTAPGVHLLYTFALLNYVVIFLNLIPLLELDGYWILADLIQVPDLRQRSLEFLRHELWRKLRLRERLSKQEAGLAVYALLGVAFSILSLVTGAFFWHQIFGGLISDLWNGGALGRLLLVTLALFVAGPLIRAGISLVRSLGRRGRRIWRGIRFKFETSWRVEAAELIDALPVFADLPGEVLSELAGRVHVRTISRGTPVVRQGERAEAFFVVRRGTLEVVEERGDADDRVIRVLGRGECFGELGLSEAARRSATVRALEDAEVFEVDKSSFDRLLASDLRVPELQPTIQAAFELRELPGFAHLEFDELGELLEHGEWINVPPGHVVVHQGDIGDAFYAIHSGQFDVMVDEAQVRTMGPGAFFGEIALLVDVPRTATVVARTPSRIFRLDREGFDRVVAEGFRRGTLRPAVDERTWKH